jgi:hypothetical protein
MNKTNKILTLTILAILAVITITFILLSFDLFKAEEINDEVEEIIYDDSISPYMNQGLTVEILRVRNRNLLDKMFQFSNSWKNKPSFYWIATVDGKEANSLGNIGKNGYFKDWDTINQECRTKFHIEEEQETSEITLTINEIKTSGIIFKRTNHVEIERIDIEYDYRTGRWHGDDNFQDKDGYGHYLGEDYEIWFNIYQADLDHDGIPYWTEVNILNTDPSADDRIFDPDEDGVPTSWEWRWGYDPNTWNDHLNLDPDFDGIENIEEYQMRKYFADPYQPDMYIETDGMQKKGILDTTHIFFKESQQIIIEKFAQNGIYVYIDDGWEDGPVNGGGEMLPFIQMIDDVVGGQILGFYNHNFADERKGIFRYMIVANRLGWCTPSKYNSYDSLLVSNGLRMTFKTQMAFTPRYQRVGLAKAVLHELGHSLGLMPELFKGVDIMPPASVRYPNMDKGEYNQYLDNYHSIMNYQYIWRDRKLIDYSHGDSGNPHDQNDWGHIYLPSFQVDAIGYEESIDEDFEDFEILNEKPIVVLKNWRYDSNLTEEHMGAIKNDYAFAKKTDEFIRIYVSNQTDDNGSQNVKIYSQPDVAPTHSIWSLIAEGMLDENNQLQIYSQNSIIQHVQEQIKAQKE